MFSNRGISPQSPRGQGRRAAINSLGGPPKFRNSLNPAAKGGGVMEPDFDYDLDEIVHIGCRSISLRTAVIEHIEKLKGDRQPSILMPPAWFRAPGKNPAYFEAVHMEALAKLRAFRVVSRLPQRE
jgi:hypothetical protein